ncbi:MAG TPA: SUF system NifU family Fe-S cluster assembly protein [Terriglobales bacterium]|nr:SUF system NifU family Fe-S cluster assembly protein [Terriglobales bacterium]
MSSELRDLYQEIIVDHSKRPRNFRPQQPPASSVEGFNPLCGDRVTVYVTVDGDTVRDVSFEGSGCAISTASASVMTETIKGKSRAEAKRLFDSFHALVTKGLEGAPVDLGKLAAFSGVSEFPSRVKCAVLAWHTLDAALRGEDERVSTE